MSEAKRNCWEYMDCGREIGGSQVDEMGICPAARAANFDGVNQGQNAGRFCWAIDETLCDSVIHSTIADKALTCMACEFYHVVVQEERQSGLILHPKQLLE